MVLVDNLVHMTLHNALSAHIGTDLRRVNVNRIHVHDPAGNSLVKSYLDDTPERVLAPALPKDGVGGNEVFEGKIQKQTGGWFYVVSKLCQLREGSTLLPTVPATI